MLIFHSYVSLSEGISTNIQNLKHFQLERNINKPKAFPKAPFVVKCAGIPINSRLIEPKKIVI